MTAVRKLISGCVLLAMTALVAVAEDKPAAGAGAGAAAAAAGGAPRVKLETTLGDIVVELNQEKAPASTANFLRYASEGFYDGTIFHRVKPDFMIQGGGFDENYARKEGLHDPIANESKNGLSNVTGTIAMARTSEPNSATSQFFINVVDNQRLDPSERMPFGYAVFGKVVEGMDVVEKIRTAKLITHAKDPGRGSEPNVNPDPAVVIKKAVVLNAGAAAPSAPAKAPAASAAPKPSAAPAASPAAKASPEPGEPAATPVPRRPPVVRPSPSPAGAASPAPSPHGK